MSNIIYLDNSATTKPFPEVIQEVVKYMEKEYGNPSSLYRMGVDAEKGLRNSRMLIGKVLEGSYENFIFTSGGTESNNMALWGAIRAARKNKNHIITTKIEHPSIMEVCKYLDVNGFNITYLDVDSFGYINTQQLESSILDNTLLVSIMHVNNEIGTIQDVNKIGRVIKNKNPDTLFHVDGVQGFCRIPISVSKDKVDLYSLSGHKIHGPKGIGALYVQKGIRYQGYFFGGGQEKGLRSGTENVPGIMGLGKAVDIFNSHKLEYLSHLRKLKRQLWEGISDRIADIHLNGPKIDEGAPHILNISFAGIRGEVLLHSLEQKGIMVSTGSACSSRKRNTSYVLNNIGLHKEVSEGAIRFSLSPLTTEEELDIMIMELYKITTELRKFRRQ